MPPTLQTLQQQQEQAEHWARELDTLLNSASVTQLLCRPPPAVPTAQQRDVLQSCIVILFKLMEVLPRGEQRAQGSQVQYDRSPIAAPVWYPAVACYMLSMYAQC